MKLVIHDLPWERDSAASDERIRVVADDGTIRPCIGCFGCWVKTPGQCVIRDGYGDMGAAIARADEVVLISRLCYGGFSPFVKNVLDRSIPYIHPDFILKNGEMHHKSRYDRAFRLSACFYGSDITEREKKVARELVAANAVNMHCDVAEVLFAQDAETFRGMIS